MKIKKFILSLTLISTIIAGGFPTQAKAASDTIQTHIDNIDKAAQYKYSPAYEYNTAYAKILKLTDSSKRNALLKKLNNKGKTVYTEYVSAATNALSKAATQKDDASITNAEEVIVNSGNASLKNPLKGYNYADMCYFQTQLNQIKLNNSNGKENILVIGDSVTAGSYAGVQNAYWQYFKYSNYQVSFMAVPGIGLIQETNQTKRAKDMIYYLRSEIFANEMFKKYTKIIIALGANDFTDSTNWQEKNKFSDANYKQALKQLIDYLKQYNKNAKYILLDFSLAEHTKSNDMLEVSKTSNYISKFINCGLRDPKIERVPEDNIHPTITGHHQIYQKISSDIINY